MASVRSPRLDLLSLPVMGPFLRWRHARTALQVPLFVVAALLLSDGWFGNQLAPKNLAGVLPWVQWRGILILGLLVAGNVFCFACPFMLPRRLAKAVLPAGGRGRVGFGENGSRVGFSSCFSGPMRRSTSGPAPGSPPGSRWPISSRRFSSTVFSRGRRFASTCAPSDNSTSSTRSCLRSRSQYEMPDSAQRAKRRTVFAVVPSMRRPSAHWPVAFKMPRPSSSTSRGRVPGSGGASCGSSRRKKSGIWTARSVSTACTLALTTTLASWLALRSASSGKTPGGLASVCSVGVEMWLLSSCCSSSPRTSTSSAW